MNTHISATQPARIAVHTGATTARRPFASPGGRAYIYVGGALVASARGATDADAEAVRQFSLTRHDRRRELAGAPTPAAQLPPI